MTQCWRIAVVASFCLGWAAVTLSLSLSQTETQLGSGDRWRRQTQDGEQGSEDTTSTCSDDMFLCSSGECIDKLNVCDGTAHCPDQSDETTVTCRGEKCPSYAYRCAYGACIDLTLKCDGKDDCLDQSDETLPDCAKRCGDDMFLCSSGECIDKLNVCDGTAHCPDQSDETTVTCRGEKCPSYAYRCAYGACIDLTLKCDGKDDCLDQSDETLPDCAKRCGDDEFQCVTDETCVDELLLCDGKRDCGDGTDESPALCANFSCPGYAFQCTYGGCIDNVNLCDGKADCADNSDEAVALCRIQNHPPHRATTPHSATTPQRATTAKSPPSRPTTNPPTQATPRPASDTKATPRPTPATNPRPVSTAAAVGTQRPPSNRPRPPPLNTGCALPSPPQHGSYNISGCAVTDQSALCRGVLGTPTQMSAILLHACAVGYALQGSTFSVCQNNATWTPPIPTCAQKTASCPPLSSASVEIVCSRAGAVLNCSHEIPIGAEARLKCNTAYALQGEPGYRKISCLPGGTWDKPVFSCTPDCGKRNPNGRPFISNGEVAVVGEFPWHAGIYMVASGVPTQVCGGTLITTKLIVSAAHCFWDEGFSKPRDKSVFKVALGKYYRDWNTIDSEEQKFDVADLFVEERYRGRKRNFQYDIAVVRLTTEAELTWAVNTVCVDWDNDLEAFQLTAGANGTVTGWGVTETNAPSNVLKSVQLPYVQLFPTCYDTVMESFQPFLTSDKFCAGYVNQKTSVCPGDSGGALVFQDSASKRYFLRGIVSVGSKPETNADRCYTQQLTAFSKFSESRKWVEQYL